MLNIVGTPLGNLEDFSLRAAKTLASSDIILSEDTRSANILLNHIKKSFKLRVTCSQVVSYYKNREFEKLPQIITWLEEGKNVSLISESGMPLVSDPGFLLVSTCIKRKISFTVIPGPTAATTALVYSGFNSNRTDGGFLFMGFLPKKISQLFHCISKIRQISEVLPKAIFIFYESPNRVNKTLEILSKELPSSEICVCRELTKKFEEVIRGNPTALKNRIYRGELVLLITIK